VETLCREHENDRRLHAGARALASMRLKISPPYTFWGGGEMLACPASRQQQCISKHLVSRAISRPHASSAVAKEHTLLDPWF
jgi:hypothetical protein